MKNKTNIKKVLMIGSGPIIIGQAAEFDYAGTQACRALKEEGIEVVLVNSNPATIMTDENIADSVYLEPLTKEYITKIIEKERPEGLLATLGGQVGLNLAMELDRDGVLDKYGVKLLGTSLNSIKQAEDRDGFKKLMEKINEPVPESIIVSTTEEAISFAESIGYPVIVRPAYTLGGTGGGVANNKDELKGISTRGIHYSLIDQILVERSVTGWKELEYEVIRDANDNCITVCNMENIDPVGVHTGDSMVIAPSQTLADNEHQILREAAIKIIRALEIKGGCNIQFALDTKSDNYYVIEVNPRVSRSSALASKATGYPIAKIAAKIALGYNLDELKNEVTGKTYASFEPSLDYVVIKLPRFPFDKFNVADRKLGSQMKAIGEVMAIERYFESAFLKALRSLEINLNEFWKDDFSPHEIFTNMSAGKDDRIIWLLRAIKSRISIEELHEITGVDTFFLNKFKNIVELEQQLKENKDKILTDNKVLFSEAKKRGFTNEQIASFTDVSLDKICELQDNEDLHPVYKIVDTCAAEFEAETPYYYSSYEDENEIKKTDNESVIVLGSGPIRIGQGIEFDYCSVHSVLALKELGYDAVIINNNPETVSTDFNISDRLYFEPLTTEDVISVLKQENAKGIIAQFGGQTAINLAYPLYNAKNNILGTCVQDMDRAEDRNKFDTLLSDLKLARPEGKTVTSTEEAKAIADNLGFPLLVRPSYVLGGRAMEIVYSLEDLERYLNWAVKASPDYPVLIDKFIQGTEIEVDAICDGNDVLIPGLMEHIEKAGVHSGDSMAVYPTISLSIDLKEKIIESTKKLALGLNIKGMLNIQYVVKNNNLYVIEVNPRSSRTVPFLSKVTGVPMVNIATKIMLGNSLKSQGWNFHRIPEPDFYALKAPVFSFAKLSQVDTTLGPEMKSTGEVMGIDQEFDRAIYKGLLAAGYNLEDEGGVLITVADRDKEYVHPLAEKFEQLGYRIFATSGTADYLIRKGLKVNKVGKINSGKPNLLDIIDQGKINLVVNTFTKGKEPSRDGFRIRRASVESNIPCFTSLDTVEAFLYAIESNKKGREKRVKSLQSYLV
ncbi:carbamoyl-phosphate synthase large subunit [Natranaerofaba carboxydovora]|uniref:carbamoyl-phosphate synthase large subunit n=1 Tax=Natranaerofaba carboxydovora TaxID=2742683 RepID=UPI001F12B0F3|nr:carbamoyl-phosphate synthase large subunit [Natranaerofaba carboxydovora]UMZ73825.1 Carbamoyl-phosphate synthase large chain [Natranaerofaba carboxydovora]